MLRVVRDQSEPSSGGSSKQDKPLDDPRVVALLERFTLNSRVFGRKYIFCPDDATLLTWGLRGRTFSDADLEAVEAWLRENDPTSDRFQGVADWLCRLDAFVVEQLARVVNPAWLQDPLNAFAAQIRAAEREHHVWCNPRILKAVFVAFLTIRA